MTEHILLVDDNEDFVKAGREFLTSQGYAVTTAANGEEALEAVEAQHPDIIMMDVMMPRMDGWAALKALQSNDNTAQIPVLMLTALRGSEPVTQSFDHGSTWYYAKPITDYHDLLLVIRQILDQTKVDQPAED